MVFCRNCGKEIPPEARFCSSCGTPVAEPALSRSSSTKSFDVTGKPRVVLASYVPGWVEVKVGEAGKVVVSVDLRMGDDMDWNIAQEGDVVNIFFRTTSRTYWSWASHPEGGPRADIRVTVPGDADLDLENRLDRLSVSGVRGVIVVNSAVASVDIRDCSGSIKVRTKTGSLKLENVNGSVSAETATGRIDFSGSLAKSDNWFRTSVGTIDIALKGDADLSVDAVSRIGQVNCTLPLADSRSDRGHVYGRLGSGTGRLRADTGTGSVTIHS
jgi:hypothetical protein